MATAIPVVRKKIDNLLKKSGYNEGSHYYKEIAQIINVTPAAINKSRQRLRKKMNLPGEVDFREYFSNIDYT